MNPKPLIRFLIVPTAMMCSYALVFVGRVPSAAGPWPLLALLSRLFVVDCLLSVRGYERPNVARLWQSPRLVLDKVVLHKLPDVQGFCKGPLDVRIAEWKIT